MSLLSFPNENELLNNILSDIETNLGVGIANNPGSIARAMTEAYNKQLSGAYATLSYSLASRFLSTASGSDLDMLGRLLNCYRLTASESDENFRYRIGNQVFSAVNANETAIRLSTLSISGVKNVALEQYGAGNGSFILYVLTDELVPSNTLMETIKTKISSEIKGFGIKAIVTYPKLVKIKLKLALTIKNSTTLSEAVVKDILTTTLNNYIDDLSMDAKISLENLNELVKNLVPNIEAEIINIYVDEKEVIDSSNVNIGKYKRAYLSNVEVISYA